MPFLPPYQQRQSTEGIYTFLNVCEKFTSFCQALKRCTQKKIGSFFSASQCICMYVCVTACTVVQAVVKANSQSNGNGQISTTRGAKTPERMLMKPKIYNYIVFMTTHANPCGGATTWVVSANT